MAFDNIYKDKTVLVTGNTGFKGSWLTTWLLSLGAKVIGYSDEVPTEPSMYETLKLRDKITQKWGDIRDNPMIKDAIVSHRPDFVFHLAAQAIVSTSYAEPLDTISTNVMGTACVLEALKDIDWDCTAVIITSDKAYDNVEWIWGYRENDRFGGKDVYSGSKGAAELIIKCYWYSFLNKNPHLRLGVARAGNVIGGGDWAKDRIVVDTVKALAEQSSLEIRSPKATRPWQHVLEPLSGYLALGQALTESRELNGEAFNFGPRAEQNKTVLELVNDLSSLWGVSIPVEVGDIPFHEATLLKLNCDKALAYLNWHSTLNYGQCISFIAEWYRQFYHGDRESLYEKTLNQIDRFTETAANQDLKWAK